MSAEGSRKPQVVVVGGQFAGRRAAKLLRRGGKFGVTLVDAKSFWEYTPGALRCLVEPRATRRLLQPHPPGTVNATAVGFETAKTQEGDTVKSVKLNKRLDWLRRRQQLPKRKRQKHRHNWI